MNDLITIIFNASLTFSAMLLAVLGILVSLYVQAEHKKWKRRFGIFLMIVGGIFFFGIVVCLLSFFYILNGLPSASSMAFNFIIAMFVAELALLGFAGLFLVAILVVR